VTSDPAKARCPSAQPEQPDAEIIGIVRREKGEAAVEPLPHALPLGALIDLVPATLRPTEVLRFSAPCAENACAHYHSGTCQLAKRIVSELPAVSNRLKPCAIRPTCRWFGQEGPAACHRCSQIITEPYTTTESMRKIAQPVKIGNAHVKSATGFS
jgi:hypothetical protein